MKKLKNLEEGSFLKLFFAFFSAAFLIAAVCMPDRNTMFSGLWQILSQPAKISTNYFAVGGYAATFLNMGLVGLCLSRMICSCQSMSSKGFLAQVPLVWQRLSMNMTA